jgi:hypothetical protein
VQVLEHWTQCGDLAGIRDAIAVAELSEPERNEWQAIWAEVVARLERAEEQTHATPKSESKGLDTNTAWRGEVRGNRPIIQLQAGHPRNRAAMS